MEGVWIKVEELEKLKQQIAELEAELEKALWLAADKQIALAALRRKIDEAPAVAYVWYEVGIRPTFVPVINGKCEVSFPKLAEFTPLISKEDLQK